MNEIRSQLSTALCRPECYPHAAEGIELLETHISWVFLTGLYAYKVKKPVKLAFLDFSTLGARKYYCEEELRLNRRFAPDLYLDVVEIRGSVDAPRIGGVGPIVDYAVRMRQFPQDALAQRVLARGELTASLVSELARRVAAFHQSAKRTVSSANYGAPRSIFAYGTRNFDQMVALRPDRALCAHLEALRRWTEREYLHCHGELQRRWVCGMVRECHGDLHLGNIALLNGALVPFDCIEFNAELRWIDVMSDVAFVVMDLIDREATQHAWLFLNAYLEATGDYSGLAVLRFYLVYRALVRAMVHLMRARQSVERIDEETRLLAASRGYVALAQRLAEVRPRTLVLMHGVSGTGKTTIAATLAQTMGALHIRSDVERKRLYGLQARERSGSPVAGSLYSTTATEATYARLRELAHTILDAGYSVIVDAAFLRRSQRASMRELAVALGVPVIVASVRADRTVLRARIAQRAASGLDASEATSAVLEYQLASAEPIASDE
ncbi:MAG: bifunctional aminoglycoside phosphotransferase/ATP-binding protein, partial [Burkholderiales bacterium]